MYEKFIKRILDIILSLVLIILLFPIMAIIATFIKKDKGPILFKQDRSGKNNKPFKIYKFRTMSTNNNLYNYKEKDYITDFGRFLRNSSLDELPQLFNILKGEMSFIGPRPWILDYSLYYSPRQLRRLNVRPGLTGLAQCNGRNNITIDEKINYDIEYVSNVTFLNDLKIVFKTIKSIFKKEGAYSDKFTIKNELEELKSQRVSSVGFTRNKYDNVFTIARRDLFK